MAHAYVETHSKTSYSPKPVNYFVLTNGVIGTALSGVADITTTDYSRFEQILAEAGRGVVKSRLPLLLRMESQTTVDEPQFDAGNGQHPVKATITRIPLEEFLRISSTETVQ